MTNIENFRSIAKRCGYEKMPVDFDMCPSLEARFAEYCKTEGFSYKEASICVPDLNPESISSEEARKLYTHDFKEGTCFDEWGVAHEPGSAAAYHMTKMYHPMADFDSIE